MPTGNLRFVSEVLLNAADASTNQTSGQLDTKEMARVNVVVSTTGTAAGTVTLEGAVDVPTHGNPVTFVTIPGTSISVSAAQTLTTTAAPINISYSAVRVKYVFSSGTGTITATLFANDA